jgi:SAM-dependent methyltransferase
MAQSATLPQVDQSPAGLARLLAGLYRSQLEQATAELPYLRDHSSNSAVIQRHVDAFLRYRRYLPAAPAPGSAILDWGCRHAVDSCLIRATMGDNVRLFGCDLRIPSFSVFHGFARLQFTRLEHPWKLPFESGQFDAVIGSGVLEHVLNDDESLKELHRVLKEDGVLVVTFLPNRGSVSEFAARRLRRPHHARLYSPRSIRLMLQQHGFAPQTIGFHQVLPTLAGGRGRNLSLQRAVGWLYRFNFAIERMPLVHRVAANLIVVARKCEVT